MVPASSDAIGITEAQICELCGTSQQRRQAWVARGLLTKAGASGCGLRDALELAGLLMLIGTLGPTDAVLAWPQVRQRLGVDGPGAVLDVVFDTQLKRAELLDSHAELRTMIDHGRPVQLVALAQRQREVAAAFQRVADASREELWARKDTRAGRRKRD
jgi:hypothetical protein